MKKTKKTLIAVLSSVFVVSASLGIASCNDGAKTKATPVSITKLTPEFAYIVGDSVHMFDHFEYVDGLTYTFTVAYEDEDAETVKGTAFYLEKEGEYTITCTATNGKETKTDTVTILVRNEKAFVQFKNREAQVDYMRSMWDTDIIALANAITIVDCEYETYIDSVTIYDAVDGSGRTVKIEDGVKIADEAGTFYNGADRFTFVYECDYVFTVVCETSGGKVVNEFTVKARESFDGLDDLALDGYSLNYDKDTYDATWDPVDGASSYYVKVDRQRATTEDTEFNIEDLLVSEFQYFDLYVVPMDASGNRMGKLVYEGIVIGPEAVQVIKSSGATLNGDNTVTMPARQVGTSGKIMNISAITADYIAFKGDYGLGTYVDFTFTGNNMPQVMFFADEINGNMTEDGGKGVICMNGLALIEAQGIFLRYEDYLVFGPNRIDTSGGVNISYDWGQQIATVTNGDAAKGVTGDYPLLTQWGLNDTPDTNYAYTVGTYEGPDGYLYIDIYLSNADTEESIYHITQKTNLKVSDMPLKSGNIVAYTCWKSSYSKTTFGYGEPYTKAADDSNGPEVVQVVSSSGATLNGNNTVTMPGIQVGGAANVANISAKAANYIAYEGNYGIGTYVDFTFTGNNMPQVMFFADKINGDITKNGGTGVLCMNGMTTVENSFLGDNRYLVIGPTRMTENYNYGGDRIAIIQNDYPLLTQSGLRETPNANYAYTVGTYEGTDGNLYIDIYLYNADTDTLIYHIEQKTSLKVSDMTATSGNIVVYNCWKGNSSTTTFGYGAPYQKSTDANTGKDEQ